MGGRKSGAPPREDYHADGADARHSEGGGFGHRFGAGAAQVVYLKRFASIFRTTNREIDPGNACPVESKSTIRVGDICFPHGWVNDMVIAVVSRHGYREAVYDGGGA